MRAFCYPAVRTKTLNLLYHAAAVYDRRIDMCRRSLESTPYLAIVLSKTRQRRQLLSTAPRGPIRAAGALGRWTAAVAYQIVAVLQRR